MYWKATAVCLDPETGNMITDPETFHDFNHLMYAAGTIQPFPFVPSGLVSEIHGAVERGDEQVEFGHDIRKPLTLVPLIPPGYRQHVEMEHPERLADFERLANSYIQVEPQEVPA